MKANQKNHTLDLFTSTDVPTELDAAPTGDGAQPEADGHEAAPQLS